MLYIYKFKEKLENKMDYKNVLRNNWLDISNSFFIFALTFIQYVTYIYIFYILNSICFIIVLPCHVQNELLCIAQCAKWVENMIEMWLKIWYFLLSYIVNKLKIII